MVCKGCKTKLAELTIYCEACGRPTESFREQFSVSTILTKAKTIPTKLINNSRWLISLLVLICLCLIVFSLIELPICYWTRYILTNATCILFTPVLLSLLRLSIAPNDNLRELLKHYPRLLLFTFLCAFYLFFIKMVCTAFSVMSYDPILNLVRLVLVLWGIAIVYPVPMLLFTRNDSVIRSMYRAYIAGKYTRWQQFYLSFLSAFRIVLSPIFPSNFLFVSRTMHIWLIQSEKFGLYEKNRDY
jgi:hypothetical protein